VFRRKRQIIGIDLGASRAKAVVLEYGEGENSVSIREYAVLPMDREQPLENLLRKLLRKLRTRCRECAISAWPAGARLRFFDGKAEPELARAVRRGNFDASSLFCEALDDYVAQCCQVTRLRGASDSAMYVACGIPRGELSAIENALRKLRYQLCLFQLAPVAVLNAFTASQTETARKEPFLLVDFGRGRMTIWGGLRGSVRVMHRVDFPWGEIPEPPCSVADPNAAPEVGANADDDALSAIFGDVTDVLAAELQRVLDSFEMDEDFSEVERIYVSGGLSNHPTVMRRLAEALQMQCVQWNPLRHIAAHRKALEDFSLLSELAHLPGAAGAAFQWAA
jgi:hypothetical protein